MSARPPIIDLPWFWACLFASMGLVALWGMGPKYAQRQLLEEQKAQGRMRAAEQQAAGEMFTEVSSEGKLQIPLRPLYGVLGAVLAIAWVFLWRRHVRPALETKPATPQQPARDV